MEWLLSLAFVPVLLCGLMCVVPMAIAAVGLRRRSTEHEPVPRERDHAEAAPR